MQFCANESWQRLNELWAKHDSINFKSHAENQRIEHERTLFTYNKVSNSKNSSVLQSIIIISFALSWNLLSIIYSWFQLLLFVNILLHPIDHLRSSLAARRESLCIKYDGKIFSLHFTHSISSLCSVVRNAI